MSQAETTVTPTKWIRINRSRATHFQSRCSMYRLVPRTIRVDKKSIAESTVLAISDMDRETSTMAILAPRRRMLTIVLRLMAQRMVARASSSLSACFCKVH